MSSMWSLPRLFVRRRRLYHLVLMLVLVSVTFLFFQLFSMNVMSDTNENPRRNVQRYKMDSKLDHRTSTKKYTHKLISGRLMSKMCNDTEKCEGYDDVDLIPPRVDLHASKSSTSLKLDFLAKEIIFDDAVKTDAIRGVLPQLMNLYMADNDKQFHCLKDKETIPMVQVNDDYCDCPDGSDEPGTSACDYRFYCRFQLPRTPSTWLPSSQVMDGVCDCCDGSDEWKSESYRSSSCVDKCEDLRLKHELHHRSEVEGAALRVQYIAEARAALGGGQSIQYGTDSAYYKLSLQCYTFHQDKYTYTICPFKHITQNANGHQSYIGRNSKWLDQHVLEMSHGDSQGCPAHMARKTTITFDCGIRDEVVLLSEADRCVYEISMTSPAAC